MLRLYATMDWGTWGEARTSPRCQPDNPQPNAASKPLPVLPLLHPRYSEAAASPNQDDVVIRARRQWEIARSGGELLPPPNAQSQAQWPPFAEHFRPQVLRATQPILSPRFGTNTKLLLEQLNESERALDVPEIDPVSGLEVQGTRQGIMQNHCCEICESHRLGTRYH